MIKPIIDRSVFCCYYQKHLFMTNLWIYGKPLQWFIAWFPKRPFHQVTSEMVIEPDSQGFMLGCDFRAYDFFSQDLFIANVGGTK